MNKYVNIEQVGFSNKDFWKYYFGTNYPNAYHEDLDMSIDEIIEEIGQINIEWVNQFTQFYDGVLDETDGYLENPTTLKTNLNARNILKIEFHPGDTLFFIDDVEIGCTGPHWKLQTVPYSKVEELLQQLNGELLFFLLLPMANILEEEVGLAQDKIKSLLPYIFPNQICEKLLQCIIYGLTNRSKNSPTA